MSKLIAIDPGELSGYVMVDTETADVFYHAELQELQVLQHVEQTLELDPETLVVMEKFTINKDTHKKTPQYTALYLIGAIRWIYFKATGKVLPLQTPGDAKNFSDNKKLHAIGFWHKGGAGHANDAFRHALLYMVRMEQYMDDRLLGETGEL